MPSRSVMSNSATPWTVARQTPLPIGVSRQEYWSGLPFPTPGDLPNPGIEPASLVSPALAGRFFTTATTGKPQSIIRENAIQVKLGWLLPAAACFLASPLLCLLLLTFQNWPLTRVNRLEQQGGGTYRAMETSAR